MNKESEVKLVSAILRSKFPKKSEDVLNEISISILNALEAARPAPTPRKGIVVMTEEASMGKVGPKKL